MRTIMTTAFAMVMGFSSLANAQPARGQGGEGGRMQSPVTGRPGGPGGNGPAMDEPLFLEGIMPLLERLDLNLVQWAEVETIIARSREDMADLMEESEPGETMREFLEVFSREAVSSSDFEIIADRMQERRDEVRAIGFEAMAGIHDVLTNEQLEMIRAVLEGDMLPDFGRMRMHCR